MPKLPVPELHGTLDKYLRAIKPVVSADQYDKTATLAAEFGKPGGLGCYLQRKLEEYADNTDNWVGGSAGRWQSRVVVRSSYLIEACRILLKKIKVRA